VTYRAKLTSLFTMAVPGNELKWNHWEQAPALGLATVQWLAAHNLAVRGHNLVWQSWRFQSNDFHRDYAAHLTSLGATGTSSWLSDTIDRHITDEMTPLRGQCAQWDVVNEGVDNHLFQDVIGPGAMAHWFQVAHEADPAAELLLNEDASIYGQTNPERVEDALAEASSLVASGAPVGAVGLESHMSPWALPSPDQVSATFAAYAKLNLPVVITEYDLKTYDKELEADYTRDFMTLCFSNPNVQAFVMWGFWDRDHWLGDSPLFNADWTLKPSGQAYLDLVFKKWWTSVAGATDAAGRFGFRGFQGDYEVTVSFAGKHQTRAFRAGPGQTPLTLQLI